MGGLSQISLPLPVGRVDPLQDPLTPKRSGTYVRPPPFCTEPQAPEYPADPGFACQLWGLDSMELLWDKGVDMKVWSTAAVHSGNLQCGGHRHNSASASWPPRVSPSSAACPHRPQLLTATLSAAPCPQALLGWSKATGVVVLSFRGTASFENVLTDLKVPFLGGEYADLKGNTIAWAATEG